MTATQDVCMPHSSSECLQGVWASKYNERAFLSMKKVGLNFLDLRMAVLVQRVVPAAYAFVIHTENPTSGAKDEIFAELVKGLGESIVSGMVPGSALSFYAKKDSLDKPEVSPCSAEKSYPGRLPWICGSEAPEISCLVTKARM